MDASPLLISRSEPLKQNDEIQLQPNCKHLSESEERYDLNDSELMSIDLVAKIPAINAPIICRSRSLSVIPSDSNAPLKIPDRSHNEF